MQQQGEYLVEMTLQLYNVGKLGESSSHKLLSHDQISLFTTTQTIFFSDKKEKSKLQQLKLTHQY